MIFVGFKQVSSKEELRELLNQKSSQSSYYFLRWAHKVSGFIKQLPPDFPSPEGQMFNEDWELRWKQRKNGYEVLLLSDNGAEPGFTKVGQKWDTQLRTAHVYPLTETRFPKEFIAESIDIAQRYFLDSQTATVHFVALTVSKKND
ncbi:MAG: hypothetical protein WBG73_17670 [Coleofasciculaceae cyanobacterium]